MQVIGRDAQIGEREMLWEHHWGQQGARVLLPGLPHLLTLGKVLTSHRCQGLSIHGWAENRCSELRGDC